jgi:hypothetical protein
VRVGSAPCTVRTNPLGARARRLRPRGAREGGALDLTTDTTAVALGLGLVALGALGATVSARRVERSGRWTLLPLQLVPFGVLVGAGAAMVRGWDLWVAIAAGAVVIPLVGVGGRWLEVRRQRRRRR